MIYTAVRGETWDSIAHKTIGDEFQFTVLVKDKNNENICDIVEFEGGESVFIPDEIDNIYRIVASPWQSTPTVTVIKAPWS